MNRIFSLFALFLLAIVGCGQSPTSSAVDEVAGYEQANLPALAKPATGSGNPAVVYVSLQLHDDLPHVWASVQLAPSVAGLKANKVYEGFTGRYVGDSRQSARIVIPAGYYTAVAFSDITLTKLAGQWHSIPIGAGQEIFIDLKPGKPAKIVSSRPLPAATGDMNQDGKVNREDAVLVHRFISGLVRLSPDQFAAGDLTQDRKITDEDLTKILSMTPEGEI